MHTDSGGILVTDTHQDYVLDDVYVKRDSRKVFVFHRPYDTCDDDDYLLDVSLILRYSTNGYYVCPSVLYVGGYCTVYASLFICLYVSFSYYVYAVCTQAFIPVKDRLSVAICLLCRPAFLERFGRGHVAQGLSKHLTMSVCRRRM